jgi:hypothetical protein
MSKPEGSDPTRLPNREVVDDTPFPDPNLYFRVFDSERDEPDSKYREDVLKLYQRWEEKYGRKWPENGLNTEDLVWLYEEAYRDEAQTGQPGGPGGRRRSAAVEKPAYPGEFITDTEDAGAEALAELPADPALRAKAIADAREKVADAAWVTDEFESEDYEKGNLEILHDAYLWDRSGKPTIMPDEAPKEELGEGSEVGGAGGATAALHGTRCTHLPPPARHARQPNGAHWHPWALPTAGRALQGLQQALGAAGWVRVPLRGGSSPAEHRGRPAAPPCRSGMTSTAPSGRVTSPPRTCATLCGPPTSSSRTRTTRRANGSRSTWVQVRAQVPAAAPPQNRAPPPPWGLLPCSAAALPCSKVGLHASRSTDGAGQWLQPPAAALLPYCGG